MGQKSMGPSVVSLDGSQFRTSIWNDFHFVLFSVGHRESKDLISFVGDICKPETIEKAFIGVDCVFHCAAYISIQFPPNFDELERVNVIGRSTLVDGDDDGKIKLKSTNINMKCEVTDIGRRRVKEVVCGRLICLSHRRGWLASS